MPAIPTPQRHMNPKYAFQYCQKIVLLSKDGKQLLLAKRKGEADYDGVYSCIGGKMEITDKSFLDGLKREKDEEIGAGAKIKVYPLSTYNFLYTKKDGNKMVLPYHLAYFVGGLIELNTNEYSDYKWIPIESLESFEPKIPNDVDALKWALEISKTVADNDFIEI